MLFLDVRVMNIVLSQHLRIIMHAVIAVLFISGFSSGALICKLYIIVTVTRVSPLNEYMGEGSYKVKFNVISYETCIQ